MPIVKNSADFAIDPNENIAAKIIRELDIVDNIFSYTLSKVLKSNLTIYYYECLVNSVNISIVN